MHERLSWRGMLLGLCVGMLILSGLISSAQARVSWIEITERVPFAGGMAFGKVGPYEKIRGRLHYAIDPDNRFNKQIVDLHLAKTGQLRQDVSAVTPAGVQEALGGDARNTKGEVEFSGEFILLKPVDPAKGNHRLLFEVTNRGRILGLNFYNDAENSNNPTSAADGGNGWLLREGYSLLWTGWNWDVETGDGLRVFLPVIVNPDGSPLVEKVNAEMTIQVKDGVQVEWFGWGNSRCYPVADDPVLQHAAVLSEQDAPVVDSIGPPTTIPRQDWQFAVLKDGRALFDPAHVYYPNGFRKGKIYELLYWAKNPRVVGLGLASIRDAMSFFHFEARDDRGTPNPLADGMQKPDPQYAYIFGISQSGRVINTMIYQGFHVDEQGRMVFEGARPDVPGGGKGAFNYRWAQTTHHPKHMEGNYFAADHFPFNFTKDGVDQVDPYRTRDGVFGDVLAVAKVLGKVPKILLTNHESEYWTRAASLVHTDVFGIRDAHAITHPNVRFYAVNGSQHGAPSAALRRRVAANQHTLAFVDHRPIGRALLTALDRWVTAGSEPPPSTVPSAEKGELLTASEHRARFPKIPSYAFGELTFPAVRHPGMALRPPRADYGPRFFMPMPRPWDTAPVSYAGLQDNVPPQYFGPPYEARVPAFDSDGNGIGGIRPLELLVPLGTYQGWNPRCDTCGAPNYVQPFDVSFWPFALTEAERTAKNDPRPSIEARYGGKADYVGKAKAAATKLREQGFMLEDDEQAAVALANKLAWPPVPTDRYPFWKME